jgi:hypothetical protein
MAVMMPAVVIINGLTTHAWTAALLFGVAVAVGLTPEMLPMIGAQTRLPRLLALHSRFALRLRCCSHICKLALRPLARSIASPAMSSPPPVSSLTPGAMRCVRPPLCLQ